MSRSDGEMVELLATKVMGLRVLDVPRAFQYDENTKGLSSWFYRMEDNALLLCTRGGGESTSREWNPLTNAADSKMVREKLAEMGWFYRLYGSKSRKAFQLWGVNGMSLQEDADTEERAVALCALKAAGLESAEEGS